MAPGNLYTMYSTLILPFSVFIVLLWVCMGLMRIFDWRRQSNELIAKIRGEAPTAVYPNSPSPEASNSSSRENFIFNVLKKLGLQVAGEKSEDYNKMKARFVKAGMRSNTAVSVFYGIKTMLTFFPVSAFLMLRLTVFKIFNSNFTMAIAVFIALIGYYMPDLWLRHKTEKRKDQLRAGLPDALDLLVICVEAGMGLDAAINRVAGEIKLTTPILSEEFTLFNLELRAGKARQDALRDLAFRTDINEFESLVTLLIQTDRFGTSVAKALRVYSDSFRTQRFQKAEELAGKMAVKMTIPLIMFIFPALFIVIAVPAAIIIYQTF